MHGGKESVEKTSDSRTLESAFSLQMQVIFPQQEIVLNSIEKLQKSQGDDYIKMSCCFSNPFIATKH